MKGTLNTGVCNTAVDVFAPTLLSDTNRIPLFFLCIFLSRPALYSAHGNTVKLKTTRHGYRKSGSYDLTVNSQGGLKFSTTKPTIKIQRRGCQRRNDKRLRKSKENIWKIWNVQSKLSTWIFKSCKEYVLLSFLFLVFSCCRFENLDVAWYVQLHSTST